MIDPATVTIACATAVEASNARRTLPAMRVVETGVALRKLNEDLGEAVISCGLAGGLDREIPTGAVIVPRVVGRPDGSTLTCDEELSQALFAASEDLGFLTLRDPLITTDDLIRGQERTVWAQRGYAAVDMETGLLEAPRVAAVRVILDTPLRELSEEWLQPLRAMIKPRNWGEMFWLAREAPQRARSAALVIKAAFNP
ncbi:MAG: hypothetical protein JO199_10120 [Candidatus Eremiobacteraeota bacterium]|nr:hypothetical protein [Candidatus Eremiobacteraeota bacterium]